MKKLLLILLCLPMIGFGQLTYVPDDNFEAYLEAYGMGNGIANDDSVLNANINTVTYLNLSGSGCGLSISDLTGIEGFLNLEQLFCESNQLTTLDVSQNSLLEVLDCSSNRLIILDLSQNLALNYLNC